MQEHREKPREIKGYCQKLFELGYPVLPIAPGHKYPALFENGGWRQTGIGTLQRQHPATDESVAQWDAWGASAGVHFNGTGLTGLDIDSLDPDNARLIRSIAVEHLGRTMERFGRKPKAMLVYACSPSLTYRRWTLDADNKVELLAGNNKMAVMLGRHPETGNPYEVSLWAADWLPTVTNAMLDAFFEALTAAFPASYTSAPGEEHGSDPEKQTLISEAVRRLNEAVLAMPVGELAGRFRQSCMDDEGLAALWRGVKDNDDSQSGLVFAMARALRQRGYSLEEYARIVMSWPRITHQASCRNPRALARAWVNSMPKVTPLNEADWFEPPDPEPHPGWPSPYRWPAEATHPARDFIYGSTYVRSLVGATYAGTKVGKSSLLVTEALAIASGRPLLGRTPKAPARVWMWNGEDPIEELERLVMAALQHHKLTSADVGDRLMIDSGLNQSGRLRLINDTGNPDDAAFKRIWQAIRHGRVDVAMFDPLVKLTGGLETNAAFEQIGVNMAAIAADTGSAIHIAHHIRKPGQQRAATSLEDGRGGGSLTAAVRSARALSVMTASEAPKCGINPADAPRYFRVTDAATNTAPPPAIDEFWFYKQSVVLANGDNVGVATLANIRYGGQPSDTPEVWWSPVLKELEPPARWRADVQAVDWVGKLIAKHAKLDPSPQGDRHLIRAVIERWRKLDLIVEVIETVDHKPKAFFVRGDGELKD